MLTVIIHLTESATKIANEVTTFDLSIPKYDLVQSIFDRLLKNLVHFVVTNSAIVPSAVSRYSSITSIVSAEVKGSYVMFKASKAIKVYLFARFIAVAIFV